MNQDECFTPRATQHRASLRLAPARRRKPRRAQRQAACMAGWTKQAQAVVPQGAGVGFAKTCDGFEQGQRILALVT